MTTHLLRQPLRRVFPSYNTFLLPAFPAFSRLNRTLSPIHKISYPSFSSTAKMADSKSFLNLVQERRTFYQITNESTISEARIKELVDHTVKHVPSAFNSQTTRVVVILKEHHQKLWDSIMAVYKTMLPDEQFQQAKGRMEGFRAGYGTVSLHTPTSLTKTTNNI